MMDDGRADIASHSTCMPVLVLCLVRYLCLLLGAHSLSMLHRRASGTSMAAPHVTGLIAVYLEAHPKATPAEVHDALLAASTAGVLQSELMLPETPNRMVYSAGLNEQQVSVAATGGPGNGS